MLWQMRSLKEKSQQHRREACRSRLCGRPSYAAEAPSKMRTDERAFATSSIACYRALSPASTCDEARLLLRGDGAPRRIPKCAGTAASRKIYL